jgi:hypothetical protein
LDLDYLRQQRYRRVRARREFIRLIEHVYEKIRDPDSGAYYYHDRRTGETSWTKPLLLKDREIPETFFLKEYKPKPGDDDYVGDDKPKGGSV